MAENKTRQTGASVADYIAARANEQQQADCRQLMAMMHKVTREQPVMWGPSIVGYGKYHYTTAAGRSGEMPLAAFAIRGKDLVVYLDVENDQQQALLGRLGKHQMGKSCLYFRRLSDLDAGVLEKLVVESMSEALRRNPQSQ